jgi:peptidoglycan/xylan/chitin deacetylase (PgdA/CDA1 family)
MTTLPHCIKNSIKSTLSFTASLIGPHQLSTKGNQLWVLMYHRILSKHDPRYATEEPGMIVEPETFRQHLQLIKQYLTPIHLSEWIDRQQKGLPLPSKACAITFDDGWADNYEYAYPIIQEQQVPITLFAVSDMIGTKRQFWPNQINQLLKQYRDNHYKELQHLTWLIPHLSLLASPKEAASYTINQLKQYSDEQIYTWLAELHSPTPCSLPISLDETSASNLGLMSWRQLKTMAQNNLVEIGSHTCNHFRLNNQLSEQILSQEIINSKQRLHDELGQTIKLFCYPNGDVCPKAIELVQQHYQAAVTTQRGINNSQNIQLHTLNRIGIHQDMSHSATLFKARLANWF